MKKKIISKLLTVVVLGSMVFTMSMSAFAAQVTPQKAEAKVGYRFIRRYKRDNTERNLK
mgnify:CR=1 FL=1